VASKHIRSGRNGRQAAERVDPAERRDSKHDVILSSGGLGMGDRAETIEQGDYLPINR
jgi:molybdopterin biosynthesis enzyme MoaB